MTRPTRLPPLARRWLRCDSGAVAVETVLLAPLLISLLFGTICAGYAMALSHSVQQLAAGTARASVGGITEAERAAIAQDYVAAAHGRFVLLDPAMIRAEILFEDSPSEAISVRILYDTRGSVLDIANGFLGLDVTTLQGSAYLAY
ncbi:TadE/TadG family type IV pilus assembly protein [Roseicyclus persicicus]|uniref:Pilus assembly protein n=1 Tax=Roseicyclus persicicus TaxID=2650661 RepID=A0A7X6H2F1_9RHOB|nr:TadE/TadG family type IV pilus assembly protein [Roseibacterium persicicum]NKX45938.1 pilus assembly protein [Roseibacterium persicicum]